MGHAKLSSNDYTTTWPDYLQKAFKQTHSDASESCEPVVIEMGSTKAANQLKKLVASYPIQEIIDSYDEQLAELYLSKHAHLYKANIDVQRNSIADYLKEHYQDTPAWQMGSWVYYPWSQQLIHVLDRARFNDLRTIRNRDLITQSDQKRLAEFKVACLGMSVGSSSALAVTLSGISSEIKLADGAVISGSNLNRILTGIGSIGKEKSSVIARQLYEMNPYITVYRPEGKVSQNNLAEVFDKPWPVKLVIDEIDDLEIKIRLRIEARKRKIPVLMATELGDSVMLDVERFDLEPNRPLFHGIIKNPEAILDKTDMTQREWIKHATAIIDPPNVPLNMQQSLLKIGTTVVTHPQLGATAMMTGGVLAFAAKQIALGRDVHSQRSIISLEKTFQKQHRSRAHKRIHRKHTKVLKRSLDAM